MRTKNFLMRAVNAGVNDRNRVRRTRHGRMWLLQALGFICSVIFALGNPFGVAKRRLAPQTNCTIKVYNRRNERPSVLPDASRQCTVESGSRAFLLDPHAENRTPALRGRVTLSYEFYFDSSEVKPSANQKYFCLNDTLCSIAISGFGLQQGDAVMLTNITAECGSPDAKMVFRSHTPREAFTKQVTAYDHRGRAIINRKIYTVFDVPTDQLQAETKWKVCYAPSLGLRDENVVNLDAKDFYYPAGTLTLGKTSYECDFEGKTLESCGLESFKEDYDVDFTWDVASGRSKIAGTGPANDFTNPDSENGFYALMKSPGFMAHGAPAIIMSPPLTLHQGDYCVSFGYNMHGADVNSLRVYVSTVLMSDRIRHDGDDEVVDASPNDEDIETSQSWGTPKWVAVGNKGEKWHQAGVSIHADDSQAYQLVFEALSGKSELGDIAVDDIKIIKGECPHETRQMPPSQVGHRNMVCGEVRMVTGNHPEDKAWSLDGAISCAGRGYSIAQLESAWMPCCVPHFGNYTLLLHDQMNDGWEGSKLEMRFFDRIFTFGGEMKKRSGDVRLPVIIGQLEILKVTYKEDVLHAEVKVLHPNTNVWCGITQAAEDGSVRQPPPAPKLMREYGVKAAHATERAGETVTISIRNPKDADQFITAAVDYDLYCYAEPSNSQVQRAMNDTLATDTEMDEKQIAATRYRITADSSAPQLKALEIANQFNKVTIKIQSDEPGTGWCSPVMSAGAKNKTVNAESLKNLGREIKFKRPDLIATLELEGLASDTAYDLFCYAEDLSSPTPHGTTPEDLQKGGIASANATDPVRFRTMKRAPGVSISRVSSIAGGFDVFVSLDAPGKVWCAAAPESIEFPQARDIKAAGAGTEFTEDNFADAPNTLHKISIRGVKPQTPYKIFCTAASLDGSLSSNDKQMWKGAHPVTSFGKFCDIPATPVIAQRDEDGTPFCPLNHEEELKVRRYILAQKDLGLEGVYRVNLLPNKTEIYNHYRKNAPFPKRYARIRAGRCLEGDRGFYEQLKVGPLDAPEDKMQWERIAKPQETSCGGYIPEGVFGRRLSELGSHDMFQKILKESFEYGFGTETCMIGQAQCLKLGSIAVETSSTEQRKLLGTSSSAGDTVWIGFKRPDGSPVPLFFALSAHDVGLRNLSEMKLDELPRKLDGIDWFSVPRKVWYNEQTYDSVDQLADAYSTGSVKKINMEQIRINQEKSAKQHQAERRRLAPAPYAGAAGTSGLDLDRSRKRGGLEYRIPPEHIEPEGKRFTVKSHPGGQSFTLDYIGWSFTVTNDRDKSLQFWNLRFQDEQLAFQFGLQEALAHYTVSERTFFFMDSWYGGLGGAARPVLRGYECPKHGALLFWDQSLCVWEQDMARPIRSHYRSGEIRDAASHYALHVRQMLTVSNYDYVTTYVFHSSGHIEMKVEFTGELYAGVEVPWWSSRQVHYGTQVTGAMRFAALHAHVVNWRIDFDLGDDYTDNSVFFEEIVPDPNRIGANYITRRFAGGEKDAAIGVNNSRQVAYEIVDEKRNTYGNYGGWRIFPGHSMSLNSPNFELYSGPAAWAKYKAFSTVFKYSELDATLPRDNKFAGDPAVCVDRYISDNETLRHADIVTWMSMGFLHVPCSEDYPLTIPIGNTLSALIRPNNWFLEDPSMDLNNCIGGAFVDPGQCAVVRRELFEAMDVSNVRGPIVL